MATPATVETESPRGSPEFRVQIRRPQKQVTQAIGVMTAGTLVDQYLVPRRDSRKKQGYQRPVSTSRVNKLVGDLKRGQVDLPTAVLLNLRNFDRSAHLEEAENSSVFKPNGQLLYVVDGQHRIEALTKLMEEDPGKWADYTVPFVCMLGASESEEMSQFYVVNSTAKSVRTDLALDLLKQQAENDPNVYTALVQKGEDWKVEAQTLTEKLDKTRLWKHRIRFPGEPKAETTLSSSGMVSSLKQLLGTPFFSQISTENRMKILEAYWEGIRDILPDPFEDPTAYALQKSSGVIIVHSLLVQVLELLRSKGWSLVEAQSYEEVLREALLALEGDTAEGETARGSDFWLSGSRGAVGSFSSNAGRRVLGARLKNDLPQFEIE